MRDLVGELLMNRLPGVLLSGVVAVLPMLASCSSRTESVIGGKAAAASAGEVSSCAQGSRPYFGDTHLHTALSPDAGLAGTKLGLDEAYRFARGETVTSNTGQKAALKRTLDFLVVADHSENLGLAQGLEMSDP